MLLSSTWQNATGGDFDTPGNWSAGVPGTSGTASFGINGTYTVNLDSTRTVNAVSLDSGDSVNVTIDLNGHTLTGSSTSGGSPGLNISGGSGDSRILRLIDGTFSAGEVRINSVDENGAILRIGAAATFQSNSGTPRIGNSNGFGEIEVQANGKWESSTTVTIGQFSTATGKAHINGSGAEWVADGAIQAGATGVGSIEVSSGGKIIHGSNLTLGRDADSSGSLLITGSNSSYVGTGTITAGGVGVHLGLAESQITVNNGGSLNAIRINMTNGTLAVDGGHVLLEETSLVAATHLRNNATVKLTLNDPETTLISSNYIDVTDGTLELLLGNDFNWNFGDQFPVISYNDRLSGFFTGLDQGDTILVDGYLFEIDYGVRFAAGSVVLTAIPEPSHYVFIFTIGMLVIISIIKRRNTRV